jgi:DNA invertase Pin-like site-specific DNA recombinase
MRGKGEECPPVSTRAVLYLRVSTGRQAEHDLSIPDQRRQLLAYCEGRGWQVVSEYVEPGASATDDRRPEFQRMMDAAAARPPMFDVILVHSFSRFFRDQFQLEFYVRHLAKNGIRLISITQDLGDAPMSVMMRQILALFDEYQSKENAKHTLRAMRENAGRGTGMGRVRRLATASSPQTSGGPGPRRSSMSTPFRPSTSALCFGSCGLGTAIEGRWAPASSLAISTKEGSGPRPAGAGGSVWFTRSSRARPTSACTGSMSIAGARSSKSRTTKWSKRSFRRLSSRTNSTRCKRCFDLAARN